MRVIKFRAWDKWNKKMLAPHHGDFIKWHAPSNWKDCYEVMQFTGLLDKAGKEIYEGDIVKKDVAVMHKDGPIYKNYEVCFEDGAFRYGAGRPIDKYVEIIGSIHENPELLNE